MDNSIVLEVDPRSVLSAIKQANTAMEGWEKNTVGSGDKMQKSLERMAEMLLKVNDKSRNSMERLTQSIEKQAAAYGKTGVEKLVAERDRIIKRLGDEQGMVDRVTASYGKMIAEYQKANASGPKLDIKSIVESPTSAVKGLLESMGPVGVGTAAFAATLGAVEAAGLGATRSLADYGVEIRDVQLRTGLAAKEVGQFSFAAKSVGQDVSIFERAMRGLTEAVTDTTGASDKASKRLHDLIGNPRDAEGNIRPTADLLLSLSKALNEIPNAIDRNKAGMEIFKKAWVEMAPAMLELSKNAERAKALGLGPSEDDVQRWLHYKEQLTEADALWAKMERKIKEGIAGTVWITIKTEGAKWILDMMNGTAGGTEMKTTEAGSALNGAFEGNVLSIFAGRAAFQRYLNGNKPGGPGGIDVLGYRRPLGTPEAAIAAIDRTQADSMIRGMGAGKDVRAQLSDAEHELSKLTKPQVGVTSLKDAQEYKDAQAKVDHLKQMIEGTKQLNEEERKLRAFEKSMDERDMTPIQKIWAQRDDLGFKPGSDNYNAATSAALRGVGKELDVEQDKVNKQLRDTFDKAAADYRKDVQKNADEQEKLLEEHAKHVVKQFSEGVKAIQDAARTADKYSMDTNAVNLRHAGRMAQISGGGDELSNLAQELATRKAIRDQDMQLKESHAHLYDMDAERHKDELENLKDRYDWEEKIAEYRNKQDEQHEQQIRQAVEPLVHTLLTNPGQFGKQLGGTMKNLALKPVENMMTDAITGVLKPTIFGGGKQDPLKISTDINNQVTAANTAAVLNLNATLATGPRFSSGGRSYSGGTDGSAAMPWGGGGQATFGSGGGISYSAAGMPWSNNGGDGLPMSDIRTIAPDLAGWNGGGGGVSAPGGGSRGGFSIPGLKSGNLSQSWNSLKSFAGFGNIHKDSGGDWFGQVGKTSLPLDNFGNVAMMAATSPAAMTGGSMLAMHGITGSARGTWGGVASDAAGGALVGAGIGAQLGGPVGAGVGAAIGATVGTEVGLAEKLFGVETPENEAKRLVKQQYGMSIDTSMAKQIVSIAQSKYSSHVSLAVRDPDVRKMLMLYAQGTGQKFPMSATTPQSGSLAESGGKLYQQATYQDGTPYTFQSNLPVMGNLGAGNNYPNNGGPNTSGGVGPTYLSMNFSGAAAANFMTGQYVTPQFVADQATAAQNASMGRTQQAANMQLPGLTVG